MDELRGTEGFDAFVRDVEPRLRAALVARFGADRGREATAEALAWAWTHRDRLPALTNPTAYLYRVGQSRTRPKRILRMPAPRVIDPQIWVEPALPAALAQLPDRQRVAVTLCHGHGWTHAEVAEVLGISRSAVQTHVERGLERLANLLGASNG
jgi:DNA-directed RNA polymerase specialized sigma24 family protein